MVNLGNFFGARGRVADPNSDRQRAMTCKAQGLVFDKDTKQCRQPARRGRAPAAGPSVASLRDACKAQGLVLDMDNKQCRASRRGAGLEAARASRAANRGDTMTVAQMRAACKAQGLVFDRETKQCRSALPKGRKSALETAYARGSLFFGARGRAVDPMSDRQLAMACKAQGLVFDKDTKQCRQPARRGRAPAAGPSVASLRDACKAQGLVLDMDNKQCRASRRGAGLEAARASRAANRGDTMTVAQMRAACKAQGLVFDRETKQCRSALPKGRKSVLETAYARGSLFFGVNRPAAHQRAGVIYHTPASRLGNRNVYDILGPVRGRVTGPASFQADTSIVSKAMARNLGVSKPNNSGARTPKFGTYARGPRGMLVPGKM